MSANDDPITALVCCGMVAALLGLVVWDQWIWPVIRKKVRGY